MSRTIFLLSLVFLICMAFTEGQRMFISKRCLCSRTYDIRPGNIKDWKVHKPSAFCGTTEIVVTLKKPQIKVCLNPKSPLRLQLQAN
ncbi:C-X-C motif chemokine 11 [Pimephales promelas]|uniref:C-X-C motif chemokine 11 n=1 Tax=Pimephales promelas TaxID=90988 RepID=UPI00195596FB|nr:C-X-C motif chemokine 11 [Pimephales promelas]KAG1958969.1 C-X-C motif chemokine 11-like [Pimephales promelas]